MNGNMIKNLGKPDSSLFKSGMFVVILGNMKLQASKAATDSQMATGHLPPLRLHRTSVSITQELTDLHWFVKSELNVIIKCGLQNSISTCNTSLSDLLCAISK